MFIKSVMLAAALAIAGPPATCRAASFDCARAQNDSERDVCRSRELSAADEALAKAYAAALAATGDKAEVRSSQRAWLEKRNAPASTSELVALYRRRIIELNLVAGRRPTAWSTVEDELLLQPAVRATLEKAPSPEGDFVLSIVVWDGEREVARFDLGGNAPGKLEADLSGKTPMVVGSALSCGGSCSNLHLAVVAVPRAAPPRAVLRREFTGGSIRVEAGRIIVDESVYSDGDPSCCPSSRKIQTFLQRGDTYDLSSAVLKPK